jgi:hypothetical protein
VYIWEKRVEGHAAAHIADDIEDFGEPVTQMLWSSSRFFDNRARKSCGSPSWTSIASYLMMNAMQLWTAVRTNSSLRIGSLIGQFEMSSSSQKLHEKVKGLLMNSWNKCMITERRFLMWVEGQCEWNLPVSDQNWGDWLSGP